MTRDVSNRGYAFALPFQRTEWPFGTPTGLLRFDQVVFEADDFPAGESGQGFREDEDLGLRIAAVADLRGIGFGAHGFLMHGEDAVLLQGGLKGAVLLRIDPERVGLGFAGSLDDFGK